MQAVVERHHCAGIGLAGRKIYQRWDGHLEAMRYLWDGIILGVFVRQWMEIQWIYGYLYRWHLAQVLLRVL